ncbi:NADH dehydrogenase [Nocardioides exalbidus]|uniref:NADH dehydrogenase n=1 Tax=Nocardioides exalbidus TaxID=402596 RepID=A0A1H4YCJ9_9ACTN|nr:FAD-dependent oxidoreductase [Nocardioides exalbidus]SED14828.1 NADH dehydrogenase [Nocardioides exalbidus]
MNRIVVVGGGYAGFYAAWFLERRLRKDEAEITVVDPRPYMTYQPFLPEVAAGAIEPRHTVVSLRRHLRRTTLVPASATRIDHSSRVVEAVTDDGARITVPYDVVVVTAGVVTRTLPIEGLLERAIGLKNVEEAVAIRDRVLTALDRAAALPPGAQRRKLLSVAFVGGGFTGVEGVAEVMTFARESLRYYPELSVHDLSFHLVEGTDRILPEVGERTSRWVVAFLRSQGATIHLAAQVESLAGGSVVLSNGVTFDADLVVWTAGNAPNPVVSQHTDLPLDERGFVRVQPDLRVADDEGVVVGAWAAGDVAAVPDLTADHRMRTVPNAQHAVRQGRLLAENIAATLRGEPTKPYVHHNLGVVATLGHGHGVFQYKRLVIKGWPAWAMHRGYHVLAVPTWERKVRVMFDWFSAFVGRRDVVSMLNNRNPREAFVTGGDVVHPYGLHEVDAEELGA